MGAAARTARPSRAAQSVWYPWRPPDQAHSAGLLPSMLQARCGDDALRLRKRATLLPRRRSCRARDTAAAAAADVPPRARSHTPPLIRVLGGALTCRAKGASRRRDAGWGLAWTALSTWQQARELEGSGDGSRQLRRYGRAPATTQTWAGGRAWERGQRLPQRGECSGTNGRQEARRARERSRRRRGPAASRGRASEQLPPSLSRG